MGANVISCGIQPTPTAQLLALQRENAVGALVITSSHNPKEWNVRKLLTIIKRTDYIIYLF